MVNTASLCGYTPQYSGLQALWTRYRDQGLLVLGVPSNDFGGQEPGGKTEIEKTAQGDYHVTFPLTEKAAVKGAGAHPFYKWAAQERPLEAPRWNFHKYLIGRDGRLKAAHLSRRQAQAAPAQQLREADQRPGRHRRISHDRLRPQRARRTSPRPCRYPAGP